MRAEVTAPAYMDDAAMKKQIGFEPHALSAAARLLRHIAVVVLAGTPVLCGAQVQRSPTDAREMAALQARIAALEARSDSLQQQLHRLESQLARWPRATAVSDPWPAALRPPLQAAVQQPGAATMTTGCPPGNICLQLRCADAGVR